MKIAIIGGVAAGTSAAAKARRNNKEAEIVLFERDSDISYAGCGLPYYISEVTDSREKLIMNTPEEFEEKYKIDVRTGHEVLEINPEEKTLKYEELKTNNVSEYNYDKLIITTGASPIMPPIPGYELDNIVPLRTVNDADKIKNIIDEQNPKKAVIVGAGLIGLEMAESFKESGLEVGVIEKLPHVLPILSDEMSEIVEDHLKEKDVDLVLDDGVSEFKGNEKVEKVITESGKELEADLVLLAIGVKANAKLAKEAGIEIGETGAIAVNEKMETSEKDIYAAGDCAESKDLITGNSAWVPLGSTANKQGRTAGENVTGGNARHRGILKTGITKIFDLTVSRTGLLASEARENGFEVEEVKIKGVDHAGYYPNLNELHLKGIFDKDTKKIIGAAVIGENGADKRIDVLSTAIYSGLTANDLFQVDLAYAPPYSTSKDAVAVLGMVAEKKLK
ncbi:MAG: FAD-dependent oxidoreductase [Bacillota bacterium]